jgi:hypothetical protein
MRAAWTQLVRSDETAFMTCLSKYKPDDISTFIDFDDDAAHDQFWTTELDAIHSCYIELISHTGAFIITTLISCKNARTTTNPSVFHSFQTG